MRIATQIAPLAESVPPKLYGGTERVVSWLTERAGCLGHDVTLYRERRLDHQSQPRSIIPQAIRLRRPAPGAFPAYRGPSWNAIAEAASDSNVLHCHIEWVHPPALAGLGVPHLRRSPSRYPGLAGRHPPFPASPAGLNLRSSSEVGALCELAGNRLSWQARRHSRTKI